MVKRIFTMCLLIVLCFSFLSIPANADDNTSIKTAKIIVDNYGNRYAE